MCVCVPVHIPCQRVLWSAEVRNAPMLLVCFTSRQDAHQEAEVDAGPRLATSLDMADDEGDAAGQAAKSAAAKRKRKYVSAHCFCAVTA